MDALSYVLGKKYTDQRFSAVNGSPKGVYATLSALQAAFPTGDQNNYLVTADGKWYYWNGSAWTAGAIYQSTGIADGTVTPKKLGLTPYTIAVGMWELGTINSSTGVPASDSTRIRTNDYILLTKGTVISDSSFNYLFVVSAYTVADKTFIETFNGSSKESDDVILPYDCYVKLVMMVKGALGTTIITGDIPTITANLSIADYIARSSESSKFVSDSSKTLFDLDSALTANKTSTSSWVLGSISSGVIDNSVATRIRTKNYIKLYKGSVIKNLDTANYQIGIQIYDTSKVYQTAYGFSYNHAYFVVPYDCYVKLVMAYSTNAAITSGNVSTIIAKCEIEGKYSALMSKLPSYSIPSTSWFSGSIDSATGADVVDPTRMRSAYVEVKAGTIVRNLDVADYRYAVSTYALANKAFTETLRKFDAVGSYVVIPYDCYIRFVMAYADNTEILTGSFATLAVNVVISDAVDRISDMQKDVYALNENILGMNQVNDTGKELLFKFNVATGGTYLSDFCFVGDELWTFPVTLDDHSVFRNVSRYSVDTVNKTATLLGTFTHNWGHCNTVDYCEQTKALIVGNGGATTNTQPEQFYIFENADTFKNLSSAPLSNAITFDVDSLNWGRQLNAVWGESNNGKYNIAYVISNNGNVQFIRKVLLGQAANQLESGTFTSGKTGLQFNGTFKVLKVYTHPYKTDFANQGTDFYNGVLYESFGFTRISHFEKILNYDGTVTSKQMMEPNYTDAGVEITHEPEGMAIKDGLMYIGVNPDLINVFKL